MKLLEGFRRAIEAAPIPVFTRQGKGRPSKAEIEKKKHPGKVGRPAGDAARLAEFRARLLATKGMSIVDKVMDIALTDGHPAQAACLKLCFDRMLPVSQFEKEAGQKGAILINITTDKGTVTIGRPEVPDEMPTDPDDGVVDVEVREVEPKP